MELICIVCPNGCHLTVGQGPDGVQVKGNRCVRGKTYGEKEIANPERTVTAVVRTTSPEWPCVPVKTAQPVPKRIIPALLRTLYSMQVNLPVNRGEELLETFEGVDVQVVYTRTVPGKG